ncbi:MAG TPA: DUF5818 domain-containing protein [Thermoanaerobaculia bacterium]|nr:DUF5818 domain-containing protein [Thermoanaerobaculia bacterium]
MKRASILLCALVVSLIALPLLADEQAAPATWTGYFTDSHCGAKGAGAKHSKECVSKCLADGGKLVFFNTGDKKLYSLDEKGAKMGLDHIGKEVTVTGSLAGDTITVEKIEPAAA